ncbi:unnamed protein product [Rotaria socialis]|uniref:Uncharacterized protein n=1 Tax=Rotaria socialis TaxID=392032 RepID=A0A820KMF5_9BILA|nr:unnamed protein product [Rotaria socialis]CAF4342711.1 unnamed protein product [Rotaria socialis]CAF4616797.1 unnamed protein product [Rotaria socialis]
MHPQAAGSTGAPLRTSSPDFSSLSHEELEQLELVLQKHALIENEQKQRLSGLRRTMVHLQQTIQNDQQRSRTFSLTANRNFSPVLQSSPLLTSSDIVQCYICLGIIEFETNNFNYSPPVLCADCHRPVCRRCGNYTSPEFTSPHYAIHLENQNHASKWRCRMCIVHREVVRKSGTWNTTEDDVPNHSPVRLLQKLAAYRASITSTSISSSPSLQNERHSSILTESTNFFARLWRPSPRPSSPSPMLLAIHANRSSSFDQIPEPTSMPVDRSSNLPSSSNMFNRRMSFIRDVSLKSSSSNQNCASSSSMIIQSPYAIPPLQTQPTTSSTITDPSMEDTTSEPQFDTHSEMLSQSLETNIDGSNPRSVDDQDDDQNFRQKSLTYDERHRKLNSISKPIRPLAAQLSSPMRISEQTHHDSLPSRETSTDISTGMDFSSVSILAELSQNSSSAEPLLTENESMSKSTPLNDNNDCRQASRSNLKNSDSWARKRALLHRGHQWTKTFEKEVLTKTNNNHTMMKHQYSNNMQSLPSSMNKSSIEANHEENSSLCQIPVLTNSTTNSPNRTPYSFSGRRRSSRRLPNIPNSSNSQINSSTNDTIADDLILTSSSHSSTEYSYHPLRENSLSNYSNRSKSIDSEASLKFRSSQAKLLHAHQTQNAKSIDISNLARKKSSLTVNNTLIHQRSIDYPCIVRKTQDLSDIVRTRMLYSKINKQQQQQQGNSFSISLEREHVPKVPRKIIIRQDNSIEISLSHPPKLRRNTLSEDYYYGYNPEIEYNLTQTGSGSSTLGLPISSSMSGTASGDRRKTIETCENIFLHAEESSKLRARTPPSNPHRILLHRDKNDTSIRTNGLGMRIVGGQECEDGSLGCFVTNILYGGPADVQGNIEVGDQILEFNGNSLIDSTYEEVRMLQDQCGDIVQLVVQHNNIRLQINGGQALSSMEISRHFETVPRLSSSITRKRRNLPPLPSPLSSSFPKQPKRQLYETVETLEVPNVKELKPILINRGRLLAQIWHDIDDMKLALTVIQAGNLPLRQNGDLPYAHISGKMLFEDRGFDMFETKIIHSSNPSFNETFVFHEVDAVDALHLEIFLWDKKNNMPKNNNNTNNSSIDDSDDFIGMIQLPLSEANLEDEPRWYELRDRQTRKPSTTSVTFKSSSAESSESVRKMPPLLKSSKRHERTKSSADLLIRALNRSATTAKREIACESLPTKRKHSVAQLLNHSPNRKNLQRASIAGLLAPSIMMPKNSNDNDEDEDDEDDDEHEKNQQQHERRQSLIAIQSEKIKRQISKGLSKLFDVHTRRSSESTPKSMPQSPTKGLITQTSISMDQEDENSLSPVITNDNLITNIINKSPRHSIISTTQQDEHQSSSTRSIPLQQMPIGQLMLPYIPSSRHSSISGSRKSSATSYCESDEDIDRYFTLTEQQQEQLNENSNFQTHIAGPGQVTPRNYENMINDFIHMGQIQLGLLVTKGLLEIDIICARDLQRVIDDTNIRGTSTTDNPPDTYVKTYLRTGTRRVQKRKTQTIKTSYNPDYHAKLKYNACNVMGRRLQVTVWQRARKFEKNQCIGEAFIQLDNLTLTQLTLAWYKLFREKLVESEFYDSS